MIDVLPCAATADWRFTTAEIADCSLHGLSIFLTIPLQRGQQFIAKLKVGGKVKLLLYSVQHCSPSDKSQYRVGAEFAGLATGEPEDDLQGILNELKARARP